MKKLICLIGLLMGITSAFGQDLSQYQKEYFTHNGDTLPVRILYPENLDRSKKYPLIILLHGAGERGNDNQKQLTHGAKLFLEPENRKKFPAVIVFPQCSKDSYWSNVDVKPNAAGKRIFNFQKGGEPTKAMSLLLEYIDELEDLDFLDEDRFYVGGLSMGGMGTFDLLRRERNMFAAAFPICGGDNVANVKKYAKKTPLWIFHGAKDDVVPPELSVAVYEELKRRGADPKLTIYPNANHNSWDPAFKEPDLLSWLFSHSK